MAKSLNTPKSSPRATGAKKLVVRKAAPKATKKTFEGIVDACVRVPNGKADFQVLSPAHLIPLLKAGLPVQELNELQGYLAMPLDKLVPMLGISKATLHRRKSSGRLDVAESDRVVRYARLLGRAAVVMESLENGRRWLASPQVGLGGEVPLNFAQTEVGAREVEDLLGRIEYGVYS